MDDRVELGGNIELSGFSEVDGGSMVIIKKIVGHYAKAASEKSDAFEKLRVRLDASDGHAIFCELAVGGKTHSAEQNDQNLFVALDKSLKKLDF